MSSELRKIRERNYGPGRGKQEKGNDSRSLKKTSVNSPFGHDPFPGAYTTVYLGSSRSLLLTASWAKSITCLSYRWVLLWLLYLGDILTLLSLFPGLLESGLAESACIGTQANPLIFAIVHDGCQQITHYTLI